MNNKIKEINSCFNKYKEYICNQSSIEHLNIDLLKQYIYNTNKVSMRVKHKESVIHWYRKNLSSDMTIKRSSSKKGSTLDIYLGVLNDFEQFLKQSDRLSLSFEDINLTLIKE